MEFHVVNYPSTTGAHTNIHNHIPLLLHCRLNVLIVINIIRRNSFSSVSTKSHGNIEKTYLHFGLFKLWKITILGSFKFVISENNFML